MSNADISVIVTGTTWMGAGVGSIESALDNLFANAHDEITMTVYALGTDRDALVRWLENALSRGVLVRMAVNRFEQQPAQVCKDLRRLHTEYEHFQLFDFPEQDHVSLHAKVVVADRCVAVVGSSNLSRRGLVDNHELALLVRGVAVSDIVTVLDRLFASALLSLVV